MKNYFGRRNTSIYLDLTHLVIYICLCVFICLFIMIPSFVFAGEAIKKSAGDDSLDHLTASSDYMTPYTNRSVA